MIQLDESIVCNFEQFNMFNHRLADLLVVGLKGVKLVIGACCGISNPCRKMGSIETGTFTRFLSQKDLSQMNFLEIMQFWTDDRRRRKRLDL